MTDGKKQFAPLSEQAKAVILGTLLGDGSLKIPKGYSNARIQIRHSDKQKNYLLWKAKTLAEIASERCVIIQRADGYGKSRKWRFTSRSLPTLTELYRLTHRRNKLSIRRKWLNQMTPLSLAVWWCDDGSLMGYGGRKGVFCTDGFSKSSVQTLARYLNVVWKVRAIVAPVGRKVGGRKNEYWRLWIRSQEELKKFLRLIAPFVPVPEMLCKIILLYKDSQLQQRWISEIVHLSNFSRATVLAEYERKRAKWKVYR